MTHVVSVTIFFVGGGWHRQLVAGVAKQQEEQKRKINIFK
jgi:hypothetical protein